MKRTSIIAIVCATVVVVAAWLAWRAWTPNSSAGQDLRVGYLPYSSALPFFVAVEKGYFASQGVSVQAVKIASANEAVDALRSGRLDCIVGVGLSTLFAVEQASPGSFKVFQPCGEDTIHWVSYLLVPTNSTLTQLADLKGKKIGTYSGTSQELVLRLLLQRIGLDPRTDVTVGAVASNLQVDALASGQFDAFLMLEPYATRAIVLHGAKLLEENPRVKHILDPFPAGANATTPAFQQSHNVELSRLVAALDEAIEFIEENEPEAKAILPRYDPSLTPDIAARTRVYRWWKHGAADTAALQKYADLLFEGGELKKRIEVRSFLLQP